VIIVLTLAGACFVLIKVIEFFEAKTFDSRINAALNRFRDEEDDEYGNVRD